jgi:hypothetical protein
MISIASDWCRDYDDFKAAQDAEEGAREHDSREYIAADEDDDRDIPF